MAETEETLQNQVSVQEWELLSQNSDAEMWQERIHRSSYKEKGLKGTKIDMRYIRKTKSFIVHPVQSKDVSEETVREFGNLMMENFGVFMSNNVWQDFYNKAYVAFS